jgi:hypothetical protein
MLLGKDFVMQGGVRNYLGETEEINNAPRYWQSSPTSPKTELSYITDAEKNLLLDANLHGSLKGGKPNKGASGLLSFDGWGDVSSGGVSDTSGGNAGAEGGQGSGNSGGSTGYQGGSNDYTTPTPASPPGVTPNVTYTNAEIEKGVDIYGNTITESVKESNLLEKAFDLYKQYGIIPNALLKLGGGLLDKIGGVSKSLQNKAIAFDLQNKLEKAYQSPTFDPFSPDASVTQLEQDLARAKAGEYSQQEYQDRYAPQMNQADQRGSERDAMNQLTPYAPYAISGQTPQESMVNQYFANQPTSSLSSSLETSYNNAKSNINNILGISTPSQQFGYSAQPYGLLSSTNMADNPYKDYLTTRGLI